MIICFSFSRMGAFLEACLKSYSWLIILGFTSLAGCQDPVSTDPEQVEPDGETPSVISDTRNWSAPQSINVLGGKPYGEPTFRDFASSSNLLHALLAAPTDTSSQIERYGLVYATYNGQMWKEETVVEGLGMFDPAKILPGSNNSTYIFWGGTREEYSHLPPSFEHSTDIYYCLYDDSSCSESISLMEMPGPTKVTFYEPAMDNLGDIYLPVSPFNYQNKTIRITQSGEDKPAYFSGDLYPRIYVKDDWYFFIYVGVPSPPEGQNDIYIQTRTTKTDWSEPQNIFHDISSVGIIPNVIVDKAQRIHVVWAAHHYAGEVDILHKVSSDSGRTWVEKKVMTSPYPTAYPISIAIDKHNFLHIGFSIWGIGPFVDNYHAVWKEGEWSEPENLFFEFKTRKGMKIIADSEGEIHLLFKGDEMLFHSKYE